MVYYFFFFFSRYRDHQDLPLLPPSFPTRRSSELRLGVAIALAHEFVEQPHDPFAVQALVAHAPADDLAHALHLVEAREIHQHGEAGEQLHPFGRSEEHTSELQSLMRISYAVFCLQTKTQKKKKKYNVTIYI